MSTVLLIESDADTSGQISQALEQKGFTVTISNDGGSALQMLQESAFSLIILAVELPRGSGYSICNKVKKDPELGKIPLIITSLKATEQTFQQHKKLKTRADAYLKKPFGIDVLLDEIQKLVAFPADQGQDTLDIATDDSAADMSEQEVDIPMDLNDLGFDDPAPPPAIMEDEITAGSGPVVEDDFINQGTAAMTIPEDLIESEIAAPQPTSPASTDVDFSIDDDLGIDANSGSPALMHPETTPVPGSGNIAASLEQPITATEPAAQETEQPTSEEAPPLDEAPISTDVPASDPVQAALATEPASASAPAAAAPEPSTTTSASSALTEENNRLRNELQKMRSKMQTLESSLQEKELEFNDRLMEESSKGREVLTLRNQVTSLEKQLEVAQSETNAKNSQVETLSTKLQQLAEKAKSLMSERESLQKQIEELGGQISQTSAKENELKSQLDEFNENAEQERNTFQKQIQSLQQEVSGLEGRLTSEGEKRTNAAKALSVAIGIIEESGLVQN